MKLYFDHFTQTYLEFLSLSELTTEILQSMGIILKGLSNDRRMTAGIQSNRFAEFEDETEQEMMEEGVFSNS